MRRLLLLICCISLLLAVAFPVHAEATDEIQELLQQMLCYYHHHQSAAKTDIYCLLDQMRAIDPETASRWEAIFTYWFYAAEKLPRNDTELGDDLPDNDSLCIVVLGYALAAEGAMRPELLGRLELALQAAQKYPNAYILCTGGGTASDAPNTTEAGQMARWLKRQGVESHRIIVEDRSTHTVQNAIFSIDLLISRYPQIRQLVLISSDYHLTRSSTLFFARALHAAAETGTDPITISACLGYEAGHEGIAEDPLDQVAHLARVSGFEYRRGAAPTLSELSSLSIDAPAELETGMELQLAVTAHYDSGYQRIVTEECRISPFDPANTRTQVVSITYAENGRQITVSTEIRRPVPPTELPAQGPAATAEAVPPLPSRDDPHTPLHFWLLPLLLGIAVLCIGLFRKKK